MKDLEGKELERGAIYYILGSGSKPVVARYKHETPYSSVFDAVNRVTPNKEAVLYSYKRVLSKWKGNNSCPVVKVPQEVVDKYQMS